MDMVRELKLAAAICATALAFTAAIAAPALAANAAATNNAVSLASEALIERTEVGPDGKERTIVKQPKDVIIVPGDRVIFTLKYANNGAEPAAGFRATNPMPGPVQFLSAAESWAEVSVDGGASWGKLDKLTVSKAPAEGMPAEVRAATAEDVTHVRWVFTDAIAPGSKGSVSFRGVIK